MDNWISKPRKPFFLRSRGFHSSKFMKPSRVSRVNLLRGSRLAAKPRAVFQPWYSVVEVVLESQVELFWFNPVAQLEKAYELFQKREPNIITAYSTTHIIDLITRSKPSNNCSIEFKIRANILIIHLSNLRSDASIVLHSIHAGVRYTVYLHTHMSCGFFFLG